jgi:hypothetical protein
MDPRQQLVDALMSSRAPNVTERAKSPMTVDMGTAMKILNQIDPQIPDMAHDYSSGQDPGSSLAVPYGKPRRMPYTPPLAYRLSIRNGG